MVTYQLFDCSSRLHSDGYVWSPAGSPHFHHSTAAHRRVEQTSNGNATLTPTEGATTTIVSIRRPVTAQLCLLLALPPLCRSWINTPLSCNRLHALHVMLTCWFCWLSHLLVYGPDSAARSLRPCHPQPFLLPDSKPNPEQPLGTQR